MKVNNMLYTKKTCGINMVKTHRFLSVVKSCGGGSGRLATVCQRNFTSSSTSWDTEICEDKKIIQEAEMCV